MSKVCKFERLNYFKQFSKSCILQYLSLKKETRKIYPISHENNWKNYKNSISIVLSIEITIENTISFGLIQSTLQEAAVGEGIWTKSLTQIS